MALTLAKSSKGNVSELKVMAAYIEVGFIVSVPFGGNAPYDLIVDRTYANLGTQPPPAAVKNARSFLFLCFA